jgi:hypothetical protein
MKKFYIDGYEYIPTYDGNALMGCKGSDSHSNFLYCIDCPMTKTCIAFKSAIEIKT